MKLEKEEEVAKNITNEMKEKLLRPTGRQLFERDASLYDDIDIGALLLLLYSYIICICKVAWFYCCVFLFERDASLLDDMDIRALLLITLLL